MKKKGIYLIQPKNKELRIIYNSRDAERVGDPSLILKVNNENIKFGQSDDFEKRYDDFLEIFGSVKFLEVLEIDNSVLLKKFKKHLKVIFSQYCLKSLKGSKKMDWMQGININDAQNIILKEYKNFKI